MTVDKESRIVEAGGPEGAAGDVARALARRGWEVRDIDETGSSPLYGLLVDPGVRGMLGADIAAADTVAATQGIIDRARPRLASTGARIVVILSRDALGTPDRLRESVVGGALISLVRSLALELGRSATTVNAIVAIPDGAESPPDGVGAASLLPWNVDASDLAATAEFLLDERSAYITGQVLHCTGGSSLLSSLTS